MTDNVQLLGISNAIVDVLAHVDHELIEKIGVVPGSMNLIDERRAHEIYEMMGPATEMSGGSVANTIAGFANLGGRASSLGIDVRLQPAPDGAPTARSHVMITEDGQRTMNTYLGACTELGVADIRAETFGKPKAVLIEGYVWDIAEGPALARKAMELAANTRTTVALSLSDSFCVERHRESFAEAVRDGVQIVIADEDEINVLMGTDNFDDTLEAIRDFDNLFVMTRSDKGSVIIRPGEQHVQEATPVEKVIDTTGAGDAYCAGFLYGWVHDKSLAECARAGTLCATAVIQQVGARIEKGVLD
jgi:sugar/nucleoside kinase (ribokinase family)